MSELRLTSKILNNIIRRLVGWAEKAWVIILRGYIYRCILEIGGVSRCHHSVLAQSYAHLYISKRSYLTQRLAHWIWSYIFNIEIDKIVS